MSYIHVEGLCKSFGVRRKREKGALLRKKETVRALQNVSFDIERGGLVGCIGPNGAGKSTTVKVLSGILTPDEGTVTVGGRIPWKDRKQHVRRIGVVFGQRMQLWWDVPILDSYALLKDMYRLTDDAYQKRLAELTEALGLKDMLHTPLRQMSLGQRMRAELCGSLLHQPEILFLDEPTIGLDAVSKLALRDFLQWENREYRTTILLTTHDMEDIAALCSRVMVLGHGQKLYDGSLSELLSRYDTLRTITVHYDDVPGPIVFSDGPRVSRQGKTVQITCQTDQLDMNEMMPLLQRAGAVREMTIQPQNIDHLIAAMYREMDL